jgi:hypothetical protein
MEGLAEIGQRNPVQAPSISRCGFARLGKSASRNIGSSPGFLSGGWEIKTLH